ncbi:MAG TPA: S1 RNA-binding domain-containing protein, partial [Mariprofundaceae bacterium]|nr:S1 RNA-binding domain-containing protein [Mariprofundaceae bacterium]
IGKELPAVGDEIEAMVISAGGREGIRLSVLEGRRQELWQQVDAAVEAGETVEATVLKEVKGGFRVDLGGLSAFMPRSESDVDARISADQLVGSSCQVAIIEATHKPENIVVSRKQPMMKELDEKRALLFAKIAVGDKVSGEVKRLTGFGAFVDIGGADALLHVSDMAWRRIENPAEMLSVGQKVSAEIIKLNKETGKLSISMKTLQKDPWVTAASTYEAGMRLTGTVRKLLDFGAVVELEPGVEGMIHRSEMSWTRKDVKPTEVLSEGDVVDVAVLAVEPEDRRIRLSLKEVTENPWQAWLAEHPVGSKITGKIKNITDFGFFVGLSSDLDGLVHLGNISWEKDGAEAIGDYKKSQEVEAVILGVDVERQRISLGIKQLSSDPFELFLDGVKRGGVVKGKVVELNAGAAMVELADGVQARLALREVPRENDALKVGDEIDAKVIDANRKRRQVELSVRQLLRDEEREAMRNYAQDVKNDATPSALALELQRKLLGKK